MRKISFLILFAFFGLTIVNGCKQTEVPNDPGTGKLQVTLNGFGYNNTVMDIAHGISLDSSNSTITYIGVGGTVGQDTVGIAMRIPIDFTTGTVNFDNNNRLYIGIIRNGVTTGFSGTSQGSVNLTHNPRPRSLGTKVEGSFSGSAVNSTTGETITVSCNKFSVFWAPTT